MRILIATNSFKHSMTANNACFAIKEGLIKNYPSYEYDLCPISDGGDCTCEVLSKALNAEIIQLKTKGPLFEDIIGHYGFHKRKKIAIIETATVAGATMLEKEQLNPLKTTTYGIGALIKDAIARGSKTIIIGVGGTCTNDGGMGLLTSLGVRFLDQENQELIGIGESLEKVRFIDISNLDSKLKEVKFIVANDVRNPLFGPNGAAYVYAKQKGATKQMIKRLDDGLKNFAKVIDETFHVDTQKIVGGGSGGGLGLSLKVFLNAKLENGFNVVKRYIDLENKIKNADLIITGEGSLDCQTKQGKGPLGVAKLAKKYNKNVYAICGSIEKNVNFKEIDKMYSIVEFAKNIDLNDLIEHGYDHLKSVAENIKIDIEE